MVNYDPLMQEGISLHHKVPRSLSEFSIYCLDMQLIEGDEIKITRQPVFLAFEISHATYLVIIQS